MRLHSLISVIVTIIELRSAIISAGKQSENGDPLSKQRHSSAAYRMSWGWSETYSGTCFGPRVRSAGRPSTAMVSACGRNSLCEEALEI